MADYKVTWGHDPNEDNDEELDTWLHAGDHYDIAEYRGICVIANHEEHQEDPIMDDHGCIPTFSLSSSGGEEEYNAPHFYPMNPIYDASDGWLIRHQKDVHHILARGGWVDESYDSWVDECEYEADYYGMSLKDAKVNSLHNAGTDIDDFDLAAELWELRKIPAMSFRHSAGYRSTTDVIMVWHPDWARRVGVPVRLNKADVYSQMERQFDRYKAWLDGDVFYISYWFRNGTEFCGGEWDLSGFYGDDPDDNHMNTEIKHAIDSQIKSVGEENWQAWLVANGGV